MPNVLYLIALENVLDNAIFENQVRRMLAAVRERDGARITLAVLLPWFELTRRGIYSNFRRHRGALEKLKLDLAAGGIDLEVCRAFVPSALFHMRTGLLRWFILSSLPSFLRLVRRVRPDVVHCRYYYAAGLALAGRRMSGVPYRVIFDIRTLLPEQGIVNGKWDGDSREFRAWKKAERRMLRRADRVVSVSPAMTARLEQEYPGLKIDTIPNFVDLESFRPDKAARERVRRELGLDGQQVLVFSGTLGGRYPADRIAGCVEVFFRVFGRDSFFLLLSPSDEKRLAPLEAALTASGLHRGLDWECLSVEPAEAPEKLNAADWSLIALADFLTSETFLPLKFSEYLALGLPILSHPANAELVRLTREMGVGEALDDSRGTQEFHVRLENSYAKMRENCLRAAREGFGLKNFAQRYAGIYRELSGGNSR